VRAIPSEVRFKFRAAPPPARCRWKCGSWSGTKRIRGRPHRRDPIEVQIVVRVAASRAVDSAATDQIRCHNVVAPRSST